MSAQRVRREREPRLAEGGGGLSDALVDELLAGAGERPMFGQDGLVTLLSRRLIERALEAELDAELGYGHGEAPPETQPNRRNGSTPKSLRTPHGEVRIEVPRDRDGSFEPQLVRKRQRRFEGFDEQILALYAGGMTTRDIGQHLRELYGVEVSPELVSKVTDAVLADVKAWQARPLEPVWAVVWIDALVVKVRTQNRVQNRPCYLAIGLDPDGLKQVLGFWFAPPDQAGEGAGFWASVLTELENRGVADIVMLCCDGLSGLPDAVEAVFARTTVQTCIVHVVRQSLARVAYKDRKRVAAALRPIYAAPSVEAAEHELERFAAAWDERYPRISELWLGRWDRIIPFLAFPPELRRIVYTTNPIESLHSTIRKTLKTRGHFPTEDAARKLIWLALRRVEQKWRNPSPWWPAARDALDRCYPDRLPVTL